MTAPGPVKQRPAGWSPFAGIARIRSLGVAVQPLSCPRPLSLSSRLRVSPALRSVQLPRSPRRRYSRCMAPMTAPRAESPACTGQTSWLRRKLRRPSAPATVPLRRSRPPAPDPPGSAQSGQRRKPAALSTAAFMLPGVPPARSFTGGRRTAGAAAGHPDVTHALPARHGSSSTPPLRRFGEVRTAGCRGSLAYIPVPVQPGCDLDAGLDRLVEWRWATVIFVSGSPATRT